MTSACQRGGCLKGEWSQWSLNKSLPDGRQMPNPSLSISQLHMLRREAYSKHKYNQLPTYEP